MGHGQEGTGTPGIYRAVTICRAGIHRVPTILTILLVMMMSIYRAVKKSICRSGIHRAATILCIPACLITLQHPFVLHLLHSIDR